MESTKPSLLLLGTILLPFIFLAYFDFLFVTIGLWLIFVIIMIKALQPARTTMQKNLKINKVAIY